MILFSSTKIACPFSKIACKWLTVNAAFIRTNSPKKKNGYSILAPHLPHTKKSKNKKMNQK